MKKTLLLLSLAVPTAALAQTSTGPVGIGTTAPDPKAALDITATGKGLLIPRMDSAARTSIAAPPDGLMVFQTNGRKGFWYAFGSTWFFIPDKAKAGDNLGSHAATRAIQFSTTNADKLTFTPNGSDGPKIALSTTNNLDFYASSVASSLGAHRFLTSESGTWLERLRVDRNGLLAEGEDFVGSIPKQGAGTRLMWYPGKGAFRAGRVNGSQWNDNSVGLYSVALGYGTTASGDNTLALGPNSTARQGSAVAIGERNVSSGYCSFALGYHANTNAKPGSFVFGDFSTSNEILANVNNEATFRVAGGFRIYTNANLLSGVTIAPNGSSWDVVSDSTKKERVVLADGNAFLERINRMRLGSWNYKGLDPATTRHYGPMAQDFYAAFGHDGVGTSGNDTTINQADFDGVNLIAIQALYRQVLQLKAENAQLRQSQQNAVNSSADLEERLRRLEAQLMPQARR
ncbi:tail fiber domain-containing protein [Hymenobacter sp. CRA2]|uniref:tail fiber domain-containing protein n=1 Tax=Hymenobacter sp. CRA2 TaxID=1955620 RepID=UPI00098ED786|nr:tail fiber domain-containing protein [Hymenobacter sp. CRA2]OON67691.1 hypothetical protein B0919_15935 [Hymenobacter sp. CRA2]